MSRLGVFVLFLAVSAGPAEAGELRAGAAAVDITPPEGTPLAGYYSARGARNVLDPLFSKALVLEQDGVRVALVVCDLISLPRRTVTEARRLVEQQTGIPGSQVMISATHTHTGPAIIRESALDELVGAKSDLGRRYTQGLPELIAHSVAEARKKLAAVRPAVAVSKEEDLSFNRRFFLRDQTVGWNPRKLSPDIVRPAGPIDPDVGVFYLETTQAKPVASYVNFAMHPDTVGGEGVSADYPGVLSRLLAECKGADMVTLFANGCCGNLNHRNVGWADPQKGPREARRIGTVLAGAVCKTYPLLKPIQAERLRVKSAVVKLPLAPITPEDVIRAREVIRRLKEPKTTFLEQVKAFQVLDVAAPGQVPGGRGPGRGPGGSGGLGVAARRDFRGTGSGHQEGIPVPLHNAGRAGQRIDWLRTGSTGLRSGQLRSRQRPLCGRLGRNAGRGCGPVAQGTETRNTLTSLAAMRLPPT